MMAKDSVFDEDEVNQWIHRTEQIRDGLLGELPKLEHVYTSAYAEASAHTENGAPAPIFMPIIEALRSRVDHAKAQITQAASNIDADNITLRKWMKAQQRNAEDTRARIQSIDTGGGLDTSKPQAPAPNAFETAAESAAASERLRQALGGGWEGGRTSVRAADGKFYDVSSATAAAIDAALAADPTAEGYKFTDAKGVEHTAATPEQVRQWERK